MARYSSAEGEEKNSWGEAVGFDGAAAGDAGGLLESTFGARRTHGASAVGARMNDGEERRYTVVR